MAKKQFIRHLEFYGFPDQNGYSSDINPVDLSDIIEKNKEQDKEIADLEGEKADKKDLVELSGTVDTLITTQSEINQEFVTILSGVTSDIETLKEIDNEFGSQLSALTNATNDIIEDVNELSGKVISFSSETLNSLDEKLDKDIAEETFAEKEDTYTKEEVDNLISGGVSGYATVEWVEEQGYINQDFADNRYAKKETVEALSDRLNESVTKLGTDIYSLSGDYTTFKTTTSARMGTLETNFATLDGKVNREIDQISATVETFSNRIEANEDAIEDLTEDVNRKANKSDLDNLSGTVYTISTKVDDKVGKTEFNTYKESINNRFNRFDENKANKSDLVPITNSAATLDSKIEQEIQDRINGDNVLQTEIDEVNTEIINLKEKDVTHTTKITELEIDLAQEVEDRIQGDKNLIGTTSDTLNDDTIWGAKRFAQNQKAQAISAANEYTNQEITRVEGNLEREHNWAEQNFSSCVTSSYVATALSELEEEVESEITTAVTAEKQRAEGAEGNLLTRILALVEDVQEDDTKISNLATKVKCITAWEGDDPAQYDDSGNGILDVLHREFHEYVEKDGIIESIEYDEESGDLIIIYKTTEGRKETRIHVGDIVDLTNYYTKEEIDANHYTKTETDNKLNNKADSSALTEVIESLNDNTEAIESLSGKVNTLNNSVDNLNTTVSALQNSVNNNTASINTINNQISTLTDAINTERERATRAENDINTRIDNLTMDCGIY